MNPLLNAIIRRDVAAAGAALERQPELLNSRDRELHSRSALHLAALSASTGSVSLLVDAGAELDSQDANGDTPLHIAVRKLAPDIVALLLQAGADAERRNNSGYSAFDEAVYCGDRQIADALRRHVYPERSG